MTFTINGMEVEIKAKGVYDIKKFNKRDTMCIMNYISILAEEASKYYREQGFEGLEAQAHRDADAIYDVLNANGCYEN